MARICGICRRSPREDDGMEHPVRLHEDDFRDGEKVLTPGVYQACSDCVDKFAPRIEERLRRTQDVNGEMQPAFAGDGTPIMILRPGMVMTPQYLR